MSSNDQIKEDLQLLRNCLVRALATDAAQERMPGGIGPLTVGQWLQMVIEDDGSMARQARALRESV